MKHIFVLIAVFVIAATSVVSVYAQDEDVYIVQRGDTLYRIARRFDTTVRELMLVNGLTNYRIYVGQRLVIPGSQPPSNTTTYTVQRGDTLYRIARRFGTTVRELMLVNGLTSYRIYVGQQLTLPGAQPTPSPGTVEGWTGTIGRFPHGSQFKEYFERNDGQRFGIEGMTDAVRQQIAAYQWTGAQVRVWGKLVTGVPAVEGRQIQVERLEAVSGPMQTWRNLALFAEASASSVYPADRWGTYHAWSAIDGQVGSPWSEGVAGSGIGESITLTFPGTIEVWGIGLDVGYDRTSHNFYSNNRVKRVTLVFSNGEQVTLDLTDKRGVQMISLARAPGPSIQTTYVTLIIEEVYPGSRYDDTCLGELQVWGITR